MGDFATNFSHAILSARTASKPLRGTVLIEPGPWGVSRSAVEPLATSATPLKAVRDLLESVLDAAQEAPGRGCMLGNTAIELLPHDEEARQIVHAGLRALEDGIEGGLRAAQAAGEIREDIDCNTQARVLVTLIQGLHVTARAELAPEQLRGIIDTALAAIIKHSP